MQTAALTPSCNVGRSASVSLEKIQERKEFIVAAYIAGLTKDSILQQVNSLSDQMQWGKLGSVRSIERTIAQHFGDTGMQGMSLSEIRSYQAGLREADFARMEKLIEKAAIHVYFTQREWQPFEYMKALKTMFMMMQKMVDNRGWNLSKIPMARMHECGFQKQRRRNKAAWHAFSVLNKA